MMALNEAAQSIVEGAHPDANILWGTSLNETLGDTVRVVAVAANFESMQWSAFMRNYSINIEIPEGRLKKDF